jgi:guanylate kinase
LQRRPYVLVISGPSGAGKSTFVQSLLGNHPEELHFSVSATTRPRRKNEQDGREYHFLSDAVFQEHLQAEDFVESAEVHGYWYGTLSSEVAVAMAAGKSVMLDVDVQGGVQIKRRMADDAVLVFLLPPNLGVLEERLRSRATDSQETITRRLKKAPEEIRSLPEYDYVVVNSEIEATRAHLEAIYSAEKLRRQRLQSSSEDESLVDEYLRDATRMKGA